ncbi:MAG: hypothetical protein IPF98_03885 [Gemmatimonadetes bacterium]|nr:hypothetical protein [Gemmatimonadota bacterium]
MQSLIPTPLHPAIVHLPIALTVLLPLFAIGALWTIRKGARPIVAWGVTTAMFAVLTLSSWAAVETGQAQEERVEDVVAEAPLESHEEAAESFLLLSLGVLGVAAIGLASGRVGSAARIAGTVGALVLVVAGYRVGHSGGQLVYEHGAASAYTSGSAEQERVRRVSSGQLPGDATR